MKDNIDLFTNGLAVVCTAIQPDYVLKIISLVLTLVSIAVSLAFTVWRWHKSAMADGKIDKKEIDELSHDVTGAVDDAKKAVEDAKKDDEKKDGEKDDKS